MQKNEVDINNLCTKVATLKKLCNCIIIVILEDFNKRGMEWKKIIKKQ